MLYKTALGIIICLLFISLVFVFCTALIKLYIQKIKQHNLKALEFQKILNKTIIETQEQVFENISQDLHDDIGQQLTFVNFQLEKMKLDVHAPLDELDKLSLSVSKVAQSIRDLSHSMNSQLVVQNDLKRAIENEVKRIKKYKRIKVNLNYFDSNKPFSDSEKLIIFRIFQEAISNILKHSKATKIDIDIHFLPTFSMDIADNGIGFDTQKNKNESMGLINMRKRAKMINFNVLLISIIDHGTLLTLTNKSVKNE